METIGVESCWLVVVGSQSCVIWMIVLDSFAGVDGDENENDADDDDGNDDEGVNYD